MGKFNIQVELHKGDDPVIPADNIVDEPENFDEDNITAAVYSVQLAFDRGDADKVVYYTDRDGELIDIKTVSKEAFDVKEMAVYFNEMVGLLDTNGL